MIIIIIIILNVHGYTSLLVPKSFQCSYPLHFCFGREGFLRPVLCISVPALMLDLSSFFICTGANSRKLERNYFILFRQFIQKLFSEFLKKLFY